MGRSKTCAAVGISQRWPELRSRAEVVEAALKLATANGVATAMHHFTVRPIFVRVVLDCLTRAPRRWAVCPECDSANVRIVPYDFVRCRQTGYHDADERFECRDYGATGDADDLIGSESDGYQAPELRY